MRKNSLRGYVRPIDSQSLEKYGIPAFESRKISPKQKKRLRRLKFLASKFLLRKQFIIFNLYYLHRGTIKAIAKLLNVRPYDIANELKRIKKNLKLYYDFFYVYQLKERFRDLGESELYTIRKILNLQQRVKKGVTKDGEYGVKKGRKTDDNK
jgi:predicted DNA-binding protein YlxM (UPF0122 family)